MHLRKQKKPNGRIYLSIVQSYRTPEGKSRSKTLWSLGYLDELQHTHPNPIQHFQDVVSNLNSMRNETDAGPVSILFSPHAKIPFGAGNRIEAGAAIVLATLHRQMRIDAALRKCAPEQAHAKHLSQLVELLTWNHVAHPCTLQDAWEQRKTVPGFESLAYDKLPRGIEMLGSLSASLREHINSTIISRRDHTACAYAFCYVANYYIGEGERHDRANRKARWEDRMSPLVQLAVMVDRSGMPIDYSVFNSTLASPLSPFPAVQELTACHPETRLIVVADKHIGSDTEELATLLDYGCGFVMLQSMRKGHRLSRNWVLDQANYQPLSGCESRFKERLSIRPIAATRNRKRPDSIALKEVALWQASVFERNRFARFRFIKRNEDVFDHGIPSEGATIPVRAIRGSGNAKPGDVGDHVWHVYWDKIAADEAMDGFCDIVTSEIDLPAIQLIDLYQSMSAVRTFFEPAQHGHANHWGVSREHRLRSHFLIAYIAACVTQILYADAGCRFPHESISATLARLTGCELSPGQYYFNYRSHLSDALAETASVDLSRPLVSATELERMMRNARQEP